MSIPPNILTNLLTEELGATVKGEIYTLPEGTFVTVFLGAPGSTMGVSKVTRFDFRTQYMLLHSEDTRTYTDASKVIALRVDAEAHKTHKLGFGA
jgi:hypothetical protein